MNVLVAQITRMGDVLQTTPLIRSIKRKHPKARITVMVRQMGKTIAERNPDIDEVLVYNEDQMYLDLRSGDSNRLLRAYRSAESYIDALRGRHFDVAYNCTHSIGSAMLLKLAEIPTVIGAHLTDDWQFVLRGPWTNYFFASIFHREYNDLNICDMFAKFAADAPPCRELVFEITQDDRDRADRVLSEKGVDPDAPLLCIQLGASDDDKRWPPSHFAAVALEVAQAHRASVVLLGVKAEAHLGEEFLRHAPGLAVPLFGKTSVTELAAILERARLLLTNDTGTMHIAAAMKCPVALISVGYVHFRETGPYGAGHVAIESRRESVGPSHVGPHRDPNAIPPEPVARIVNALWTGDLETLAVDTSAFSTIDVLRSGFAPDGCLEWYPVIPRPIERRDVMRIAFRAMWLDFCCVSSAEGERDALERMIACYRIDRDALDCWLVEWHGRFTELADLAGQGGRETTRLIECLAAPGQMRQAQESVARLMRLDEEIRLFGQLHLECRPLIAIARFERDNLEGVNPLALAQTTLQIYRDLETRAALMDRKLEAVVRRLPM